MDVTFGALDAFAFVVLAVIFLVAIVIVVNLGKLPGQLARQWGHPQAAAVNVAGWLGIATGGLLWPLALIWAFMVPTKSLRDSGEDVRQPQAAAPPASMPASPVPQEDRP
jgi:Protein of unknown function (DUF3302)